MDPERWQRVEEFYHAALQREPSERAAFLKQSCPSDDLRQEVEALLGFDAAGHTLLDAPAWEMPFAPGERLGPYEILEKIGAGGMGQVWKARDTRIGRTVAIKICAKQFSERFGREARAIAALNHPHVCTLYDVGPNYLVMEYVDGHPLKGRLPADRAIAYAREVLEALDATHCKGIVHRDLKPANILVTASGVKLLDFGLAKMRSSAVAAAEETGSMNTAGERVIAGTPQYMAPEQIEGKPVDARTDIFAFGCVLHEMLTGQPAFGGKTASKVMAEVLAGEPVPVAKLQPELPAVYSRIVRTCLEKDPEKRFQSAREALRALEWAGDTGPAMQPPRRLVFWAIAGGVAGVLAIVGIIAVSRWPRAAQNGEKPLIRLSVDLGPDALKQNGSFVAISLDGRNIVYPMRAADGKQQLAMRPLRDAKATLLSGTDNATAPFFSPDGEWIGFFALGQLKKISAHGGAPMNLLPAAALGGGWSEAGEIFVTPSFVSPLMRIPAAGGVCAAVTQTQSGEVTHRWPQALPRGRAVLFTSAASPSAMEDATIQALSLQTGATKILQRSAYYGRYVPSGHLLFVHQGSLYAARFDPDRLEVRGAPAPILDDIGGDPVHGAGQFDVSGAASGSGTLVYREGKAPQGWPLIWVESSGATRPLLSEPGVYSEPRLSPDGQRLAIVSSAMGSDIYVYDWRRDVMTRLTFDGHAGMPIWSPDGKHIVYRSTSGAFGLLWTRADGGGQPEKLLQDPNNIYPTSFSPDGRLLAYHLQYSEPRDDIWILPLDLADPDHPKAGKPRLFLRDPFDNQFPVFSPDGKWIAYRSGESGRWEVYVRPYPGPGGKWQISGDGGEMPYWSKTPRQLFYKSQRARMMVLDYSVEGDSFVPGKPRLWTTARVHPAYQGMDLAPDGRRFAALSLPEEPKSDSGSVHVTFLLNFFDELRRRVP